MVVGGETEMTEVTRSESDPKINRIAVLEIYVCISIEHMPATVNMLNATEGSLGSLNIINRLSPRTRSLFFLAVKYQRWGNSEFSDGS